jgi:hypothetical protein
MILQLLGRGQRSGVAGNLKLPQPIGAGTDDQNSRVLHSKLVRGPASERSHFDLSIVIVSRSIFVQALSYGKPGERCRR